MTTEPADTPDNRRSWFRDPLVIFALFAVGVFAVDLTLRQTDTSNEGLFGEETAEDESATISVTPELIDDLRTQMAAALDQSPDNVDVSPAVEDWIETEMLVREAQRRGLDRDDPIVRHRLARKMSFVLDARESPGEPDESTLRAAYETEQERYRVAGRYTIRQFYIDGIGDDAENRASALLAAAASGASHDALRADSDTPPGGPVLRGRTPERLEQLYGPGFIEGLADAPLDGWLLRGSTTGWHVLQIQERELGRTLTFDEARNRVLARWQRTQLADMRAQAIEELRSRYHVEGWQVGADQ